MLNRNLYILFALLFILHDVTSDCTDEKGNPIETTEDGVGGFLHDLGCSIQRGAKKIGEGAKKLGEKETWQKFGQNIEEGARKLGDADTWKNLGEDISDGAKRLGTSVKDKFSDIKEKISGSSSEEEVLRNNDNISNSNYDNFKSKMMDTKPLPLLDKYLNYDDGINNHNNSHNNINTTELQMKIFQMPTNDNNSNGNNKNDINNKYSDPVSNDNYNLLNNLNSSSSLPGNGESPKENTPNIEDRFLTDTPRRCPDGQVLIDEAGNCRPLAKVHTKKATR